MRVALYKPPQFVVCIYSYLKMHTYSLTELRPLYPQDLYHYIHQFYQEKISAEG